MKKIILVCIFNVFFFLPILIPALAQGAIETAKEAYENEEYSSSFIQLLPLAMAGNAEAQFYLGKHYDYGRGTEIDYVLAVEWYLKSATQGNSFAQNNLGILYESGQGVTQDFQEALKWFSKSAEQGESYAMVNLANLYIEGNGVKQNYVVAFNRAA